MGLFNHALETFRPQLITAAAFFSKNMFKIHSLRIQYTRYKYNVYKTQCILIIIFPDLSSSSSVSSLIPFQFHNPFRAASLKKTDPPSPGTTAISSSVRGGAL